MIQGTIHADGIDWAAQTYVEALGFRELDRFVPPVVDQETRVIVIDRRLEVRGPQYASQIDWADALAFRTLDYTPAAKPCRVCGQASMSRTDDLCDACDDDDLWGCC